MRPGERRTRRCSRRRGMIGFWDFKLSGAPPLLSFVVRQAEAGCTSSLTAVTLERVAKRKNIERASDPTRKTMRIYYSDLRPAHH